MWHHIDKEQKYQIGKIYASVYVILTVISTIVFWNFEFYTFDAFSVLVWTLKTVSACSIAGVFAWFMVQHYHFWEFYLTKPENRLSEKPEPCVTSWSPFLVFSFASLLASTAYICIINPSDRQDDAFGMSCLVAFCPMLIGIALQVSRLKESDYALELPDSESQSRRMDSNMSFPGFIAIYWMLCLIVISVYSSSYSGDYIEYGTYLWLPISILTDCICSHLLIPLAFSVPKQARHSKCDFADISEIDLEMGDHHGVDKI